MECSYFFSVFFLCIVYFFQESRTIAFQRTNDSPLPSCHGSDMKHYEKNDELTRLLKCYHDKYPSITKLGSVGKSVKGQELWYMQITDNPNKIEDGEPMFKYIGNMHGNEVISRQMLIYLIEFLCDNYLSDKRVKKLVDSTNIFIMPSMNPDGFEVAKEGECGYMYTSKKKTGRNNAKDKDLNRDFPDQFKNWDSFNLSLAQVETRNIMHWIYKMPFVLSANLHGGSVVASYPYDSNKEMKESGMYSKAPDDPFFQHLALTYAKNHPIMKTGHPKCPYSNNESFKNGITNGAYWYNVPGGMQDFNYLISNCFEITVELSCCKYPKASVLSTEWKNNKESLLAYIEQVHRGVKGKVTDMENKPIKNALIHVVGIAHPIKSIENGDYWRLLLPGSYTFKIAAQGFLNSSKSNVVVSDSYPTILNFTLTKRGIVSTERTTRNTETFTTATTSTKIHKGSSVSTTNVPSPPITPTSSLFTSTKEPSVNKPIKTSSLYEILTKNLKSYQLKFPNLIKLRMLGADKGRNILSAEVTSNVDKNDDNKANIALIAGLKSYDGVGREVIMKFLHFLTKSYTENNPRIRRLLSSVRLHLVPMIFPYSLVDSNNTNCKQDGRNLSQSEDISDKFITGKLSNESAEVVIIKDWLAKTNFLFSAILEGGDMVVSYPPDMDVSDDPRINGKKTSDDDLLKSLSLEYSVHNKKIYGGKGCKSSFRNRGVSVGLDIEKRKGSLNTYVYRVLNSLQINIYLSCCRNPTLDKINDIWDENKESLLKFSELAISRIYGKVKNINGVRMSNVVVKFIGTGYIAKVSSKTGFYQKYLIPNSYTAIVDDHSLDIAKHDVVITSKSPVHQDFILSKKLNYKHHKYNDLVKQLRNITKTCPSITVLTSIGKSIKGKEIWLLEMSDNPGIHESREPEFAYISGIHGNELMGRELSLLLARHLCMSYGKDASITKLINSTRIFILPLLNPDGAEIAIEGSCSSEIGKVNANNVDLASDFPVDEEEISKPTQPESLALSNWMRNQTSLMYATLHSGSLVVGYPYTGHLSFDDKHQAGSTTDEELFRTISRSYSKDHPSMSNGQPFCPGKHVDDLFKDGIVNVGDWEGHSMPLLDYNYATNKGFGFAIFTGCCNAPAPEEFDRIWNSHKKAMLKLPLWVNKGVKGVIFDSVSKKTLPGASVQVDGLDFSATTSNLGDFWRVLPPGSYKISAKAQGYNAKQMIINIPMYDKSIEIEFALDKSGIIHVSGLIFLALIASCVLVFLLVLFLLAKVCHWQKKGRKYNKNGFLPLHDLDNGDANSNIKRKGKTAINDILMEESELSDDEVEEELVFSETEFSNTKS